MKNLIKPLKWQIRNSDNTVYIAKACNAHYRILKFDKNSFFPDIRYCKSGYSELSDFYISELSEKSHEYSTLKAAKAACQNHYIKMILNCFSPEARAILEQHLNLTTPNP